MPMQLVTLPVGTDRTRLTATGCFVSMSQDLASLTHASGQPDDAQGPSVWVALPVGRQMLVAAGLVGDPVPTPDLPALPAEQVRDRALQDLLRVGTTAALTEIHRAGSTGGWHHPEQAAYHRLLSHRIDQAFGFVGQPRLT
jgi:hypothetical protein